MGKFNSEWWFTDFKRLADKVYQYSDGKLVTYHEKMFDSVKKQYDIRHKLIKVEMFGKDFMDDDKMDRHKITALYIQLFLENKIFDVRKVSSAPYPNIKTVVINELYCLDIMRVIFRKWNGKVLDIKKFEGYKPRFIELLVSYRKCHTRIDKISPHFHFTYALAHVIYFIEQNFMV
jgi:hypothetical protein